MDTLHDLGRERADLDAYERTQEHAHGERVEYVSVDGILADRRKPRRKDDLENVGADGGHGGDAEDVDEHGERDEPAAHAHDGRHYADDDAAQGHDHAGDLPPALAVVLVKADRRRDVDLLDLLR